MKRHGTAQFEYTIDVDDAFKAKHGIPKHERVHFVELAGRRLTVYTRASIKDIVAHETGARK